MLLNFFRRILASKYRISYAQMGEDIIVQQLIKRAPSFYVDIGANHPAFGNNTYYFYLRGGRGICVEPNKDFVPLYRQWRPGDNFVCSAVSDKTSPRLSLIKEGGHTDWRTSSSGATGGLLSTEVPNRHVNDILSLAGDRLIDLLSVDIESSTADVIEAIDFDKFRIASVCVEIDESVESKNRITRCLESGGFAVAASNPLNAIFLHNKHS